MDTPELDQLYRRYQRYERLAKQYNALLDERTGDSLVHLVIDTVHHTMTPVLRLVMHVVAIPKTVPRDRPTAWYVAKYVEYRAKADDAHDLYWAMVDEAKKRDWDALDRDGKLAKLRDLGAHLTTIQGFLAKWRAKVPAWEREQAEREPPQTLAEAWFANVGNPHAMVDTMTKALQEATDERDWLLDQL